MRTKFAYCSDKTNCTFFVYAKNRKQTTGQSKTKNKKAPLFEVVYCFFNFNCTNAVAFN